MERLNSILLPPQGMFWGYGGRLRLLEAINDQRMQKWYNFHPKVTYYSSALSSNIILKLILRPLEVIWDWIRSFEVILLCKSLVEGVSDIKLSLCIRQLDLLCLYFHEHVFWGHGGGWKEATRGSWRLLMSILLPRSNLTVWESTNLCQKRLQLGFYITK